MGLELFFRFVVVLYLFTAAHLCYSSGSMEQVEVLKHLNRLNKPPVKSIKSPDGDIIDCVHISHQPAFDHPLLKNHTIKMRPSDHPNWIKDENIKMNASKVGRLTSSSSKEAISQLWHLNGKCPKGTVPIIRTTKEDILRADSVQNYGKKKSSLVAQPSEDGQNHEYAHAQSSEGIFHGAKATFSLWNPRVQEQNEFSLSQLWVVAGPNPDLNTIEAGWHVDPMLNGDTNTRFFIFWTNGGYKDNTGCYNLLCPGFIQTSNEIAIGGTLATSQVGGSKYEITILVWRDTKSGDWWLQVDGKDVGYWPSSLYSYLSKSAAVIDFGGEVINSRTGGQHTSTQMGSGYFPQEGFGKASYIRNIEEVDESNALRSLQDLNPITPSKGCYDLVMGGNDNTWGSYFFFGGPGRNQNCP